MLKKVFGIVGLIITGLNFGATSSFSLIPLVLLNIGGDSMTNRVTAITSLIIALLALAILYACAYAKKREHERVSGYIYTLVWSFAIGAIIASVFLFYMAGQEAYKLGG